MCRDNCIGRCINDQCGVTLLLKTDYLTRSLPLKNNLCYCVIYWEKYLSTIEYQLAMHAHWQNCMLLACSHLKESYRYSANALGILFYLVATEGKAEIAIFSSNCVLLWKTNLIMDYLNCRGTKFSYWLQQKVIILSYVFIYLFI